MPEEEPLLLHTDTGPTLHWRGIDFYPRTDPVSYARRKARVFSPLSRSLYFVPSLGLGYGLKELLQSLPPDSSVLCVEAYQEVMAVAMTQGVPRDRRLVVVRTDDPEGAASALRSMGVGRFRRVVEVPLCAGYRLAPQLYGSIYNRLQQEIMRFWQNRMTLIAMGSLQVRNVLANLPLLGSGLDFSALSTVLPVVVTGAGPSLEHTLPVLIRQRERFALVAVDTALPVLSACGLVPDVLVALEAQPANNLDFIPAPRDKGTILACDLSVHPSVARLFAGRICFFSSEFAPLSLWGRLEENGLRPQRFPALGSVGVAAAHAALRLTRESIFITGLDLSFPGASTHAKGSPSLIAMHAGSTRMAPAVQTGYLALAGRRLVRQNDKHGRPVLTDRVLSSYRDSLEEELRQSSERVWDCGETGLPLGVRWIATSGLEQALQCVPPQTERVRIDRTKRFARDRLKRFVESERALLERVALAAGRPAVEEPGLGALLSEADYTWTHFADVPDLSAPAPGFVARARVASLYYAERLRRIESVL